MEPEQLAASRFSEGFNCAQAVFSAYAEQLGMERNAALKVSAGFGGGMGSLAGTCGVVSGAVMAIGLKYGATEGQDRETKLKTYALVREFAAEFKARRGAITCRELLGYDISTPEGKKAVEEQGLAGKICPGLVQDAAEIVAEILAR